MPRAFLVVIVVSLCLNLLGIPSLKTKIGGKTIISMKAIRGFLVLILAVGVFFGCTTVPYTGRSQFSLMPEGEVMEMSRASYREAIEGSKVITGTAEAEMINRVGRRIAPAAEEFLRDEDQGERAGEFDWEFNLIDDDETVNAWAMPGGKIAFYTGILPLAADENGVAVVMGHEVAHVLANHGRERLSQLLLFELGATGLSLALREEPETTRALWMTAFGLGGQAGLLLPYSRLQEYEADRIGLILTARAGYDPRAAIPFWERMRAEGGRGNLEFLSTHPASEKRIEEIKGMMPEVLNYYRPLPGN